MPNIFNNLPDFYKTPQGTILRTLLEVIQEEDEKQLSMATDARKELFITTASGRYLLSLASQYGFAVPRWAGLDTGGTRKLAIPAIFLPKQSKDTFRHVVEAFYSKETLHPSFTCDVEEPYALIDGDYFTFETDFGKTTVTFKSSMIGDIGSTKAGELAGIINSQQNLVYADTVSDRVLNTTRLRITSNSYGVEAFVKISGGSAQNILHFPQVKKAYGDSSTVWSIEKEGGKNYSDSVLFTYQSGTSPAFENLDIGDLLCIRGLEDQMSSGPTPVLEIPFSLLNGDYEVLDCGYISPTQGYFKIRNLPFYLPESGSYTFPITYTQKSVSEFGFTSSVPRTIYFNKEYAIITEPTVGNVLVTVPPVPPVTRTYLEGSAHLHGKKCPMVSCTRGTVTVKGLQDFQKVGKFSFESNECIERFDRNYYYSYQNAVKDYVTNTTTLFLSADSRPFPYRDASSCIGELAAKSIVNPVLLELGSNVMRIETPGVASGFDPIQEITIQGISLLPPGNAIVSSVDGGYTEAMLNKNHIISRVDGKYAYEIELFNPDGTPCKYKGAEVLGFDVYSLYPAVEGADVKMTFATDDDRIMSGLEVGAKVKMEKYGTILNNPIANHLRDTPLLVRKYIDNVVYLSSDKTVIFNGKVIEGGKCRRSSKLGGSAFSHFLVDPFDGTTGNWNANNWFQDAGILSLGGMISNNAAYVGAYLYDPAGEKSTIVVGLQSTKFGYNDLSKTRPFVVGATSAPGELTVDSIEGFPPQGWIAIDYGNSNFEGPVYYSSYSGTGPYKMFIDKSYVFKKYHGKEAEVRLVTSRVPVELSETAKEYPFYIVDAMSARDLVATVLQDISASGIRVEVLAQTPALKYYEPVIDPFVSNVD